MLGICQGCGRKKEPKKHRCPNCLTWYQVESTADIPCLDDIESAEDARLDIGIFNHLWGGGIVTSSVTLLGGVPGAGKSTLSLQLCDIVLHDVPTMGNAQVLYIAGEENLNQIKGRANRLKLRNQKRIRILNARGETHLDLDGISKSVIFVIVDSLPGIVGERDDIAVVMTRSLKAFADKRNAPVVIIDQVNKELEFLGRMALQHDVDTTIALEGSEDKLRTLKVIKNRHGPAGIKASYEMTESGLWPRKTKESLPTESNEKAST